MDIVGTFLKISGASGTEFETYINIWSADWKTNHSMIQPVINPSDLANLDNVYAFIPFLGSSDSYSLYFQPNPESGTSDTTLASNFTKGSTSSISITPIHS
ncbi:MAG: hypothetical protein KDD99_21730 [Bacteroidetes bacterium]|nr:hypothetical protein [Bacteroidota bacterium]